MPDLFGPHGVGDRAVVPGPGPRKRRGKAWIVWLAGAVVVALAIAAVVIGSASGTNSAGTNPAGTNSVGINGPTAALLQLDTSEQLDLAAPEFSLTDQHGRPMTLTQFRGKSVVLTFNDDQCTDLCTLLAEDVLAADHDLGKAQSTIAFVSINANPYYPDPATVKQWTDQHGLGGVSNWYYGTASPSTLSALADDYGVPIKLDPENKTIEHGTEIFFIDPQGQEVRLGEFGTGSADTAPFGHAIAQVADDLLPAAQRTQVAGQDLAVPGTGSTEVNAIPAPIELPELGNSASELSTASDAGEYTVINFWASTCTACITEMPSLESEHRALGGKVAFVGVDVADKTTAGRTFARRFGITYPLLSDGDGATAGRFAISGLPYTVVLDPRGTVIIRHPGAFTTGQLDYLLRSLDTSLPQVAD
ncbi:redoxin domain-containing protein [Gryllotalpicola sp.]|uniref:redoxin domain-containing protein n=1 Tax=Gryllotalpicola sp. TaxID=1932787 RepID=UPI00260192FD|nr:redoxin domain-containing protein [Gryllotalpicola sp.]